jgi:hypothetical protein
MPSGTGPAGKNSYYSYPYDRAQTGRIIFPDR